MSGWTGLTMPDRHVTDERTGVSAYCQECWDLHCSQELPCRCCLAAEVERLTGLIDAALAECERHPTDGFVLTWKIERILRGES